MQRDSFRLVDRGRAASRACLHEISRDLSLAVDGDALARQRLQRDAVALAAEADFHASMRETLGVQARSDAGALEYLDTTLFKDASADTPEHVLGAAVLHDDRLDALAMKQLAQQQA